MRGRRTKKLCLPNFFTRKNSTDSNGASHLSASARFSQPGKTNKLVSCSRGRRHTSTRSLLATSIIKPQSICRKAFTVAKRIDLFDSRYSHFTTQVLETIRKV